MPSVPACRKKGGATLSDRDITELLNDYVDGRLSTAETKQLLAELEQSAELREQLALIAVTERLLVASKSEPVSSERVMRALREKGLMTGQQRRIESSDQQRLALAVAVSVALILLVAGGACWWWQRSQLAEPKPVAVQSQTKLETKTTGTVSRVQPVDIVVATTETNQPTPAVTPPSPPTVESVMVLPAEMPLSAFEDSNSPASQGDGSNEPGFVPPPESVAKRSVPIEVKTVAGTHPRDLPQTPLLFVKLRMGRDATPTDLGDLLAEIKTRVGLAYRMEIKSLDDIDANPEKNPVLYSTGHYRFAYTPAQRAKLRKFMLAGGMMVFDAGLGSKPFYDSARRELGIIFRDVRIQRLSPDHPVFRAYYDVARIQYGAGVRGQGDASDEPWFEGVTVNCRTVAMVSRWGMAIGWEKRSQDSYPAYPTDEAIKLGVNLFSYAIAVRSGAKQPVYNVAMDRELAADKLFLGQVVYDGEWKTRPTAPLVLLRTFNQRTEVPVKFGIKELGFSDPKIFDAPLLYITGHERFVLTNDEASQLRKYLLNGGFLFAEACCGRKGFDQAFRTEMKKVLPDQLIKPIPTDKDVYSVPNLIKRISVTPSLANLLGTSVIAPRLEGIEIGGHYAVIYSPYGMAGSWEMDQSPYALGYNDIEALKLAQNILMYAITH